MNPQALLERVQAAFPPIGRPPGPSAYMHAGECSGCHALRESLHGVDQPMLPLAALRSIYDQVAHLSAAGWRWVLPSYLAHCLSLAQNEAELDSEFLTFNLGASMHGLAQSVQRLTAFSPMQTECLVSFLEWCGQQPEWAELCGEDIDSALAGLSTY
jgi:hypothetical protein